MRWGAFFKEARLNNTSPVFNSPVRHLDRKHGKTAGDNLSLHHDFLGHLQADVGEVPKRAHAAVDEFVGHALRIGRGHAENRDVWFFAPHPGAHLFRVEDFVSVDAGADFGAVDVKDAANLHSVFGELLVAEQGAAERTGADEAGATGGVPAEEAADGLDQAMGVVADAGLALDVGQFQVFAHHDGVEVHVIGKLGRRDERLSLSAQEHQLVQVSRHPANGRGVGKFHAPHANDLALSGWGIWIWRAVDTKAWRSGVEVTRLQAVETRRAPGMGASNRRRPPAHNGRHPPAKNACFKSFAKGGAMCLKLSPPHLAPVSRHDKRWRPSLSRKNRGIERTGQR